MKTENFIQLIRSITGRDFDIKQTYQRHNLHIADDTLTMTAEIQTDTTYWIYRVLPASKREVGFMFKTPKNVENLLRSFVNTFTTKYREPNPARFDYFYGGVEYLWVQKTEREKESAYLSHVSNMYSKEKLMEQVRANLSKESITNVLCKYGFYPTLYGVGIFVLFSTVYEMEAIEKFGTYLNSLSIPYTNEFSNARWVYRFKIGLPNRELHQGLLETFNSEEDKLIAFIRANP